MKKHTPGPWYRGEVDNSIYIWEEGGDGGFIAEVSSEDTDAETLVANARLIAAAPELLEALELCRKALDFPSVHSASRVAFQYAVDAIAKATGGES